MIYLGEDGIKEFKFGLEQPDMAYPFLFFLIFYFFLFKKERAKRKNKIRNLIKFTLSWGTVKFLFYKHKYPVSVYTFFRKARDVCFIKQFKKDIWQILSIEGILNLFIDIP